MYVCEMLVPRWMSLRKNSCFLPSVRHQGTLTGTGDRRKTKIGEIVNYDQSAHQHNGIMVLMILYNYI